MKATQVTVLMAILKTPSNTRKMPTLCQQKPCLLKIKIYAQFIFLQGSCVPDISGPIKTHVLSQDNIFFCMAAVGSSTSRVEDAGKARQGSFVDMTCTGIQFFTASLVRKIEYSIRWPFGVEQACSGMLSPAAGIFFKSDQESALQQSAVSK
jgi:hypothetical protein